MLINDMKDRYIYLKIQTKLIETKTSTSQVKNTLIGINRSDTAEEKTR